MGQYFVRYKREFIITEFDYTIKNCFFRESEVVGDEHSYNGGRVDRLPSRGPDFLQTIFEEAIDGGGHFPIAKNPRGRHP